MDATTQQLIDELRAQITALEERVARLEPRTSTHCNPNGLSAWLGWARDPTPLTVIVPKSWDEEWGDWYDKAKA